LAVGALYKILVEFEYGGHTPPLGAHLPPNVTLGYDVGKISVGCLVIAIHVFNHCLRSIWNAITYNIKISV